MTAATVTQRGPGFVGTKRRAVGFLHYASGCGNGENGTSFTVTKAPALVELLRDVPPVAERLYLLGAPAAAWGSWARTGAMPDGWAHSPRGHHLPRDSTTTPALRFVRPDGRELELRNAAEWFGDQAVPLGAWACAAAWTLLGHHLDALPAGGELLASPSQSGRDLLARTLPRGHSYPVLSDELRELLAATSPQGRVELLPPARTTMPGLFELDARTAYGACLRSLGSGPVVHDDVPVLPMDGRGRLTARCRLRVSVTVPDGWAHLGILGAPGKPARFPRAPGETFEAWADGWEIQTALDCGWKVTVLERLLFEQGAPLDGWATTLRRLVVGLDKLGTPVGGLAARAVRNMLVTTVGAFHQIGYRVTRTALDAADVPAGVAFTQDEAGGWVWEERRPLSGSAARFSHPEWSAQIWARARVRLLSTPATVGFPMQTGALHVPFERVVALRTDALYLTADPGWDDDGAWGRYRLKGALPRARRWPDGQVKLFAARDAGRAALARYRSVPA